MYKNFLWEMTKDLAEEIKTLRIEKGYSWRMVSQAFADAHSDLKIDAGNQIDGMELCFLAMTILGEETSDGWN